MAKAKTAGKGGAFGKAKLQGINHALKTQNKKGNKNKFGGTSTLQRSEGKGTGARTGKIRRGGNLAG